MKNKYLLCTSLLALFLTGCSTSVAKLNVKSDEVVTIDATAKVNPSDYLKDVAEDAEVNYSISDGVMTITVSKDDKSETFEVPVTVQEPRVSIDEDITIDTYVGYDIEEYIHEDEGVSHTTNFNEETGELSVTFTKGEWTTTLDSQVEVLDSDPVYAKYDTAYTCAGYTDYSGIITLYKNGTCVWDDPNFDDGTWEIKDGSFIANGASFLDGEDIGTISEDGKTISFYRPNVCSETMGGEPLPMTGVWTKVED